MALERLGRGVAALAQSASFTVSIERSIAPEWQNSATIDWATMFGEM